MRKDKDWSTGKDPRELLWSERKRSEQRLVRFRNIEDHHISKELNIEHSEEVMED